MTEREGLRSKRREFSKRVMGIERIEKGKKEMSKGMNIGLGGVLLSLLAMPVNADLNCTATPDCAALGYNKAASDCLEGAVKCPFNTSRVFCLRGGSGSNNFSIKAKVTNMNIVFSDGTNAATMTAGKDAIGVAIVTETNSGFNHGFIVAKDQPMAATYADAVKGCNDYKGVGTESGDWALMNLEEAMYINAWDASESSTGTNQYASLRTKLALIPHVGRIGYSNNISYCLSGSPDTGGTYLQEGPVCLAASGTGKIKVRVTGADLRYEGTSPVACGYQTNNYASTRFYADIEVDATSNTVNFMGSNLRMDGGSNVLSFCRYLSSSGNGGTSSTSVTGLTSISANEWTGTKTIESGFSSDHYWTISEYPGDKTRPYYIKLGATAQNKVILGAAGDKAKKALYRCVLRF